MDRRNFLSANIAAVLGLGIAGRKAQSSGKRPPNIIVMVADDLGWKEPACFGNPYVQTPGLDRLAQEGVKFTNAFVSSPSCSPSRASFITGKAPHTIGVLGLTHIHPDFSLSPSAQTFPKLLNKSGCRTAIQGKWHASFRNPPGSFGYQKQIFDLKRGMASLLDVPSAEKPGEFIRKNKDRQFYLELNFIQTHRLGDGSFKQAPGFPIDPDKIKVLDYWALPDWREIRSDAAGYWSRLEAMDATIAEILQCLDDAGIAENTLVIFWGDNGPPFPGAKMCLYDRGIGTPLLMRWPGKFPAGLVREELAGIVDLAPTILESAGINAPADFQGLSLLPLAEGKAVKWRGEIFAEMNWHIYYQPMRAVRTKEWKLIWNLSSNPVELDQCRDFEWAQKVIGLPYLFAYRERPQIELYHLADDPNELRNLVEGKNLEQAEQDLAYGKIVSELLIRLKEWRRNTRDLEPRPKP